MSAQNDEFDDDLQLAFRRSLEPWAADNSVVPEGRGDSDCTGRVSRGPSLAAKRTKSEQELTAEAESRQRQKQQQGQTSPTGMEDDATRERIKQREIRAAAAERRLQSLQQATALGSSSTSHTLVTSDAGPSVNPASSSGEEELHASVLGSLGLKGPFNGNAAPLEARDGSAGPAQDATGTTDMNHNSENKVGLIQQAARATAGPAVPLSSEQQCISQAGLLKNAGQAKGARLSVDAAHRLFHVVFGSDPSAQTISRWTNQGFRFSEYGETSLGLVQREGGPCGVLAPVQALLLKYLLFPDDAIPGGVESARPQDIVKEEQMLLFSKEERTRALVAAIAETLWTAGESKIAVLALIEASHLGSIQTGSTVNGCGLTNAERLHQMLSVVEFCSLLSLKEGIEASLLVFESGIGALLLLFSALLSRTLVKVQADRDDPEPPLVTPPFGHASQEIVNLLLSGQAVPNVFDGVMDLGGGMSLKGISGQVEVGFLTLLESLNLCKVGQNLKCPRLPIWVVGSESHYTVLFALDKTVQDEGSTVDREEMRVRQAFDSLDTSGGGGFITPEALDQLAALLRFELPASVKDDIGGGMGVIVWQELWKALLKLDADKGGLKHLADAAAAASQVQRKFNLFHFNGIAKSVLGHLPPAATLQPAEQKPRLMKLWVSVPPKWTPDDCMAIQPYTGLNLGSTAMDTTDPGRNHVEDVTESTADKFSCVQHAPLADCIRTRWPRANCAWDGDAPSIV